MSCSCKGWSCFPDTAYVRKIRLALLRRNTHSAPRVHYYGLRLLSMPLKNVVSSSITPHGPITHSGQG